MGKTYHILRYLWGIILLMPVLGAFGMLPEPTADMYSPAGWAFMSALMDAGYMMPLIGLLSLVCAVLLFMNKTALAAILMAPFVLNILLFHAFVDGTLFVANAVIAWVFILLNIYFLWVNKEKYRPLW